VVAAVLMNQRHCITLARGILCGGKDCPFIWNAKRRQYQNSLLMAEKKKKVIDWKKQSDQNLMPSRVLIQI